MDDGTKLGLVDSVEQIDISHSRWVCPCCGSVPQGTNFKIRLTDTAAEMSLIEWTDGKRVLSVKNVDIGQSGAGEIEKTTIFEGCFHCLTHELQNNPLARGMFKALWMSVQKQQPMRGGRRLMPNVGHGRLFNIEVA